LQVKGKKIDLTRDQLVELRDEIDFYLETPPELTARRGPMKNRPAAGGNNKKRKKNNGHL